MSQFYVKWGGAILREELEVKGFINLIKFLRSILNGLVLYKMGRSYINGVYIEGGVFKGGA